MNRTTKIQAIGKELNDFMDNNLELDPFIIVSKVNEIADKYGVKYHVIQSSNGINDLIRQQLFILGDLIIMETNYNVLPDSENDARIDSVIIGIADKEKYLKTLDPGNSNRDRLIYDYLKGKEYSETFS